MQARTAPGNTDPDTLPEPGSLAFAGGWLTIADINHLCFLKGDPASGHLEERELQHRGGAAFREWAPSQGRAPEGRES